MFIRESRNAFLAVSLGLLLAACGGGDSGTDSGGTPPTGGTPPPGGGTTSGTASLSWLPPQENTDGSPVSLAGYRIYRGTSADSMSVVATVNSPGITSYVVQNLASGTHYFAVSAYNSANAESDRSPTASKIIP